MSSFFHLDNIMLSHLFSMRVNLLFYELFSKHIEKLGGILVMLARYRPIATSI